MQLKHWYINKTENPSKDALDKTEKFANCDQGDKTDHTDQTYQTDQTNIYSHRIEYKKGGARDVKHAKIANLQFRSVSDDHQCKRC